MAHVAPLRGFMCWVSWLGIQENASSGDYCSKNSMNPFEMLTPEKAQSQGESWGLVAGRRSSRRCPQPLSLLLCRVLLGLGGVFMSRSSCWVQCHKRGVGGKAGGPRLLHIPLRCQSPRQKNCFWRGVIKNSRETVSLLYLLLILGALCWDIRLVKSSTTGSPSLLGPPCAPGCEVPHAP